MTLLVHTEGDGEASMQLLSVTGYRGVHLQALAIASKHTHMRPLRIPSQYNCSWSHETSSKNLGARPKNIHMNSL